MKKGAIAMAAAVGMFAGCTSVDDLLGEGFVPENQDMVVRIDTLSQMIYTYQQKVDSAGSTNLGIGLLGRISDPVFGKTEGSMIVQYSPSYYFTSGEGFYGYRPRPDSLFLVFTIAEAYGDTINATQKFDIFEVSRDILRDSAYYSNFDAAKVTDFKKLFTFEYKGGKTSSHSVKLSDPANMTIDGRQFMQDLVDADTTIYENDTLFIDKFKGFYIAPADDSPQDAALYRFTLSSFYFTLYAINKEPEAPIETKDTLSTSYYFDDGATYYNTSVNLVKNDYTGTPAEVALQGDTLSNLWDNDPLLCLNAPLSLAPMVRFDKQKLKDIATSLKGSDYRHLVVNKAHLIMTVKNRDVASLDKSPARLGMYTKYSLFRTIPDYNPTYEAEGYSLPYGGYLNRANGNYAMDITTYIQRLIDDKSTSPEDKNWVKETTYLGVTSDVNSTYGTSRVEINGMESTEPMKLILTYTLIK